MSDKPSNDADREFDILVAETMGSDPDHPPRLKVMHPIDFRPDHPSGGPHVTYHWPGFSWPFSSAFVTVPVSWLDTANEYDVLEDLAVESSLWGNSNQLATCRVRRATAEEIAADLNRRSIARLSEELFTAKASLDAAEREYIRLRERYAQIQAEYDVARRVDASSRPLSFENPPPPEPSTSTEEQPNGNTNNSGQT